MVGVHRRGGTADRGPRPSEHVSLEDDAGKVGAKRQVSSVRPGPGDSIRIMGHDVIAIDDSLVRGAVGHDGVRTLERGVVLDQHVGGPVEDLKESSVSTPGRTVHVEKEVVPDQDPHRLLAATRPCFVSAGHVDARPGVTHDVVAEGHVLDGRPGGGAVLIPGGEEDRESDLRVRPVALEDVAVDEHATGVLQLEKVLDRPVRPLVRRMPDLPRERFGEVVAPDLDVRGHEPGNGGIGPPEHHVFAGRFEVVVDDLERARAVPPRDRLRVPVDLFEVGEVRVDDRRLPRVHGDPPPPTFGGIAVEVTAVEDDVVRQVLERGLSRAEQHEIPEEGALAGPDLDADEAIMMRAGRRRDHPPGRRHELRHHLRVRRIDARSGRRKGAVGGAGTHDDPVGRRLVRQLERTGEGRSGFERDDITRPRFVESRLEITPRGDGDCTTGRVPVRRVDGEARALRCR